MRNRNNPPRSSQISHPPINAFTPFSTDSLYSFQIGVTASAIPIRGPTISCEISSLFGLRDLSPQEEKRIFFRKP